MPTLDDILSFVREETGWKGPLSAATQLRRDCRVWGDDMWELMEAFGKRYNVEMSGFLWYFHSREEGQSIGGFFFKSPDKRVEEIPVTPGLLLESARRGKWAVEYPPHQIPDVRWDIRINQYVGVIFLTLLVMFASAWLIDWFFR